LEIENGNLMTASHEGLIQIWDMKTSALVKTILLDVSRFHVYSLALLPNENVACGYSDGTIQIWNIPTGLLVKSFSNEHAGKVKLIVLDNQVLASSGECDKTVKIWNESLCVSRSFHLGYLSCFVALPNKQFAAVQFQEKPGREIRTFDANTGAVARRLVGHESGVCRLLLLDEVHMASSSSDETIKIWNLPSGQVVRSLVDPNTELSLSGGSVLVTASFYLKKKLRLWDWKRGVIVSTLDDLRSLSSLLALKKSNKLVVTYDDEIIKVINMDAAEFVY
jgi:WD40 repeat protein